MDEWSQFPTATLNTAPQFAGPVNDPIPVNGGVWSDYPIAPTANSVPAATDVLGLETLASMANV